MVVHELPPLRVATADAISQPAGAGEYLRLGDIVRFLQRSASSIALATLATVALGVAYLAKTEPIYSAYARIVIDPEPAQIISQDPSARTIIFEAAEVASKVEIVKSEAIALSVIEKLDMTADPELMETRSWRSRVTGLLRFMSGGHTGEVGTHSVEDERLRRAMAGFLSRVEVRRVGQSYVLEIGYNSRDPARAAVTANSIAMAYIQAGINSKAEAARSGAVWLEGRLLDVGRRAKEATLAVQDFRVRNNMPQIGNDASLDERQIADTNTQLLAANAQVSTEKAKLETLDEMLRGERMDGYVDEALRSSQIQRLRDAILLTSTRLNDIRARYAGDARGVKALEDELAELNRQIRDELLRIRAVYQANLDTALARKKLLEADFNDNLAAASQRNDARAELAELESRAATYRRMYENVLQQLMATTQRESFPVGDARIVTPAARPFVKSWPKPSVIVPFSVLCGIIAGIGVSALRRITDHRVASNPHAVGELGLAEIGRLPAAGVPRSGGASRPVDWLKRRWERPAVDPLPLSRMLTIVRSDPRAPFSRALRAAKNKIESGIMGGKERTIGIISVAARQGTTAIASNLAHLYQLEGFNTALLDAALSDPTLSLLASKASTALGQAGPGIPSGDSAGQSQARGIPTFSAAPLPRDGRKSAWDAGALLDLKDRLTRVKARHEVVIVDLPSLDDIVDLQGMTSLIDAFVLVASADCATTVSDLERALGAMGRARSRVIGIVINNSMGR